MPLSQMRDEEHHEDKDAVDLSVSAPIAAVESTTVIDAPEDEEIMEPSEGYAPDDLVSDHSEDQGDDDDSSDDEGADAEAEAGGDR